MNSYTPTAPSRPIRRAPAARPPDLPAGMARVMSALKPFRHVLKPGSLETLAVLWADLHDERDAGRLEDLVVRRLALPASRRYLIGPFDPRDRVGPPRDVAPVDRQPLRPTTPRTLADPPAWLEASP